MLHQYQSIYLASNSPRRKELLTQLGVAFTHINNEFDETQLANETPLEYVERLAMGKALSAKQNLATSTQVLTMNMESLNSYKVPILAADTIVVLENEVLGKPVDKQDAVNTLSKLSGKTHQVLTSVVVVDSEQQVQKTSQSSVTFEHINLSQINTYCDTLEPMGKAGSYAIQGVAASFIKRLVGSYSGVMGLPLFETRQMLDEFNIKYLLN
ncbi:nucleoside triphosphate pyrophosphatase [Kangiella sp. HZ709]|uniref:Maf family protein n=1 Tax=Kangiella sp. HZ709 TaxID=2666328 RepID=UPI0012B0CE68|nr:Maf family protein [Kangiella sp. HZ709]MRX27483.1 septum formation inhibitor Maf [Kangiella sp. HZ709]